MVEMKEINKVNKRKDRERKTKNESDDAEVRRNVHEGDTRNNKEWESKNEFGDAGKKTERECIGARFGILSVNVESFSDGARDEQFGKFTFSVVE